MLLCCLSKVERMIWQSPWEGVGCRNPAVKGQKSFRGRSVCDSQAGLTFDRKLVSEGEQNKQ